MGKRQKIGGLWDDPERLERYQKLFAKAFPGQTALDILHRRGNFFLTRKIRIN